MYLYVLNHSSSIAWSPQIWYSAELVIWIYLLLSSLLVRQLLWSFLGVQASLRAQTNPGPSPAVIVNWVVLFLPILILGVGFMWCLCWWLWRLGFWLGEMANRIKEDEKNERAIRALLKLPDNRRCINCNSLVCYLLPFFFFWTFCCPLRWNEPAYMPNVKDLPPWKGWLIQMDMP